MNSKEVDSIICATDAGREGECIFRYIYDFVGCKKPVERLWISSLTAESIRQGFANKELSEFVKERGLGTPATRAATIERIITVGYVERTNKTLRSTDKGRKIIEILPEEVKNIELTAEMEQKLAAIEKGEVFSDEVISQTKDKVNRVLALEKNREHISLAPPKQSFGKCPKCGGSVFKGKTKTGSVLYYCENSSLKKENPCIFRVFADDLFFKSKKQTLGDKTMQALLSKGKVKIKGLYSAKTGKTYDAVVCFGDDWTDQKDVKHIGFRLEFDNDKKGKK